MCMYVCVCMCVCHVRACLCVTAATSLGWRRGTGRQLTKQPVHVHVCMCVSCACMFVRDSCHQFGVAERYRPSINKAACTCSCMYVCVMCVYVCA